MITFAPIFEHWMVHLGLTGSCTCIMSATHIEATGGVRANPSSDSQSDRRIHSHTYNATNNKYYNLSLVLWSGRPLSDDKKLCRILIDTKKWQYVSVSSLAHRTVCDGINIYVQIVKWVTTRRRVFRLRNRFALASDTHTHSHVQEAKMLPRTLKRQNDTQNDLLCVRAFLSLIQFYAPTWA